MIVAPKQLFKLVSDCILDESESDWDFSILTRAMETMSEAEQAVALTCHSADGKNVLHTLMSLSCTKPKMAEKYNVKKQVVLKYLIAKAKEVNIIDYLALKDTTLGSTPLHFAARNLDVDSILVLLKEKSDPAMRSSNGVIPADLLFHNHEDYEKIAICIQVFIEHYQQHHLYAELRDIKQKTVDYLRQYFVEDIYFSARKMPGETDVPRVRAYQALFPILVPKQAANIPYIALLEQMHAEKWGYEVVYWMVQAIKKMLAEKGVSFHCDVIPSDAKADALTTNVTKWTETLIEKMDCPVSLPAQFFIMVQVGDHWFPAVFMSENDTVDMFVIDSAGMAADMSPYTQAIEKTLSTKLKNSYTYVRKDDDEKPIQNDEVSCSRFGLMHIVMMSYFSVSEQLRKAKPKQVGNTNFYRVYSDHFQDRLAELLVPAQSRTLINNLSDDIKYAVVGYDGKSLIEKASEHSDMKYNPTVNWYKQFFERNLILFLTELPDSHYDVLKNRQALGASSGLLSASLWQENTKERLMLKAERMSRLFITSGLGSESTVISVLYELMRQLNTVYNIDRHGLSAIERQMSTLIEKAMRQLEQVNKLILSIDHALTAVTHDNATKAFEFMKSNTTLENSLFMDAEALRDPDEIKEKIVVYLKSRNDLSFFKLNLFTVNLLREINSHPETRRVFLEVYPIKDILSNAERGAQPEVPEEPHDLTTDTMLSALLANIVTKCGQQSRSGNRMK